MPNAKVQLPRLAHQFLHTKEGRCCRPTLTLFHRWLREHDLTLAEMTEDHLEGFWQGQLAKDLAPCTWHARRCRLHKYLYWLHRKDALDIPIDPSRLRHMHVPLPGSARRFLVQPEHRHLEPHVRNLHDWLERKRLALHRLTPTHLEQFLRQPIARPITQNYRSLLLRRIEPYLTFLHDQGLVCFRCDLLLPRLTALPETATDFVDTLRPVRKPETCKGYLTSLRDLHGWLETRGLEVGDIDRGTVTRWVKDLADRDLAPVTRNHRIQDVRIYLRWLAERGDIDQDPDGLIRKEDLPKLPSYLPRPLPVAADRELQRRLRQGNSVYCQALFLMRRSGVRIGELVRLELRCLDDDLHGHIFLKVPLGKLDNERLVPLDDETCRIARKLQDLHSGGADLLIAPYLARKTVISHLGQTLKTLTEDLDIPGPVVSHRLRHTYATELLNAGMSLIGIMKLLGHRSLRMTMRYAAVTQQTVVRDYEAAMQCIAERYCTQKAVPDSEAPDPDRSLRDVIAFLRNHACPSDQERLIRRLHKLRYEIAALKSPPPKP